MSARPFPVRSATAGKTLPAWLVQTRAAEEHVRQVQATAVAYARASGGRVQPARAAAPVLSVDAVNALLDAAASDFLASQSEAAFCQAGVVAPPDSLMGETPRDFGEGF